MLDTLEGKERNVTTHAGFLSAVAEGKDLKGFEPTGLFFVELNPEFGGPAMLLDAAELGADLGFELAEAAFASPDRDEKPSPSRAKSDAKSSLHPKKEDRLSLASADLPKEGAPDAGKPVPATAKDRPVDADGTGPSAEAFDEFEDVLARMLGLDGIKRIVGTWGFQGKALLSDVRLEAPSPRNGVPAWFEQPSFRTDRLPTIPADASDFVLTSFDPGRFYQHVEETAKDLEPGFAEEFAAIEAVVHEMIGLGLLREDLLRHVGPSWAAR